ncbi:hypothetical protein WM40_21985 [Robbsia andropogonis]|uniref:Uncharacterized protein n=1 Tax=Robbsia andropogonis TaxID=28092 RepID=A0A0F5JVM5_9BURK|nr:hypothetical protein [Robbsia andropogonis]KKB61674.1 hypothetical protein WM40_21985 [Robbsia andropogonis]MCP1120826.1 hypothetical protein [Robbsia andropogonis]MCP1130619.1 hypothetical protein [Robbsia andropogonis]
MSRLSVVNHVISLVGLCSLLGSPLAIASAKQSLPAVQVIESSIPVSATYLQNRTPFSAVSEMTTREPHQLQTALVDSCEDPWYWRSGIEELTCGFSGQGWWN